MRQGTSRVGKTSPRRVALTAVIVALLTSCDQGQSAGGTGSPASPVAPAAPRAGPASEAPANLPHPTSLTNPEIGVLAADIRNYMHELRWSDMRYGGRCGDSFAVISVDLRDVSLRGQTGEIVTTIVVIETNPPRYTRFPWEWCYGSVRDTGRGPRTLLREFNIERWDSGWRLAREQRRMSPF